MVDYLNGITVIIPTYNRKQLLDKTLFSLCFQSLDSAYYEVIVIDDGSSDGTEHVVASYENKLSITYFYQEDNGFRVAKARNIGINNARFSICLFLDSGVLASVDLLQNHLQAHRKHENLALIGFAYGFNEFEPTGLHKLTHLENAQDLNDIFLLMRKSPNARDSRILSVEKFTINIHTMTIPWILFWTCHASASTTSLKKVGGFDEYFHSWGGEDVELALRLYNDGVVFDIARDCHTIHCPHERPTMENKKSSRNNCRYIFNKHPSRATYLLSCDNNGWEDVVAALGHDSNTTNPVV